MRELRFRGWSVIDCEMIYEPNFPCLKDGVLHEDDYILMQYIGLKDKNDKEIYEGDILLGMGFVEYMPVDARFAINLLGELNEICFYELEQKDLEIIGNIYENTELPELSEKIDEAC